MVILRIAAAGHPDQPPCPLVIDGVGVIEGRAFGILRAAGQADVALLAELRTFEVRLTTPPARSARRAQRRAADHIHAFDKPRVDCSTLWLPPSLIRRMPSRNRLSTSPPW